MFEIRKTLVILAASLSCAAQAATPAEPAMIKDASLALTPPMGWNSWNTFGCDINEGLIRETADALVSSGMRDAGYVHLNLDDCWHGERDADGFIQPDPKRFPSGMKALADYVHGKGLKFGLYSDAGEKTCAGRPGSQGYEFQDALQYARWGVDYLKYDWCNTGERAPSEAYRTMAQALKHAGRPVVFSICEWGEHTPWSWGKPLGHLWRTTGDITNCWDCTLSHGNWNSHGVMRILDMQDKLREHAGPGHWNDPDMLEVGNMSTSNEDRAHFAMWAMLAAPLIAGNDVRSMSDATRELLTNADVIAVDQDALGIQGFPYKKEGGIEIWFRPLAQGDWAMVILNRNATTHDARFDWQQEQVDDGQTDRHANFKSQRYRLRDLIAGRPAGDTRTALSVRVAAHDVAMYRLTPL